MLAFPHIMQYSVIFAPFIVAFYNPIEILGFQSPVEKGMGKELSADKDKRVKESQDSTNFY